MHYDLKGCPICKGGARMVVNIQSYSRDGIIAYVTCRKCGLATKCFSQNTRDRDTKFIEQAAEAWNERGGSDDRA